MKRHRKQLSLTVFVLILLMSTLMQSFAIDGVLYEKINEEEISSGVVHRHIVKFHKNGWFNANVVFVDLDNQDIELDLLKSSGGLQTKESLSQMANQREDLVAAINGDYFYMTNPDSPIGAMIKDGEVISSPVFIHDYATFSIDKDNSASANYWDYDIVVFTQEGKAVPIRSINKYTHEYQSIMMVDRNWGKETPGYNEKHYDMVEVIVENDIVREVRRQQAPTKIPENGYALLASQANAKILFDNFKVGDEIKVNINIHGYNLDDIKLAIGGGNILVKDGQAVSFAQSVTGNHPRTAIGISRDRKQLILVTIDGRHKSFRGVDGRTLARLMIDLGSHEAIIMDGGGSTTSVIRGLGDKQSKLVNYPSDGGERKIINGLALVNLAGESQLKGIKAELSHDKSFVGVGREISIKAYDLNNNPLSVDHTKIKYHIKKGKGNIVGNKFTPTQAGEVIIEVDYLGKKAELYLKVMEDLAMLKVEPELLKLGYGQSVSLQLMGLDNEGYSAPVAGEDVVWKDEGNLGTFDGGVYMSGHRAGKTILTASLNGKSTFVPVHIGEAKSPLGSIEKYNVKFSAYPADLVTGKIISDARAKVGNNSIGLEYNFAQGQATKAAYLEFDKGQIILPRGASKLGVWVYTEEKSPLWIRAYVRDGAENRHTIDFKKGIDWIGWKYLEADLPQSPGTNLELERIYLVEPNGDNSLSGRVLFDGLDVTNPKEEGDLPKNIERLEDPLNSPYKTRGRQIFIHSGITLGNMEEKAKSEISQEIAKSVDNNYSLAVFTSSVEESISNEIRIDKSIGGNNYKVKESGENLIVQLNNRGGGLRQADYTQWDFLLNGLNKTSKKNIFITLPRPVWGHQGFTDELEIDLFKKTLTKISQGGKNVFVLYGGESQTKVELVDGVRYISVGTFNNASPKSSKFVEFNILEDEITYQIKGLF